MCSENNQCRQGVSRRWRTAAVRQVQVIEALYEGVRQDPDLLLGRLQPLASQVLPALQPDRLRPSQISSAVYSLQQSAMQYVHVQSQRLITCTVVICNKQKSHSH